MTKPAMWSGMTAGIIAGGKSQRFGSPKALAAYAGKTMIEHAIRLAEQLADQVLISIGEIDYLPEMPFKKVPDIIPDSGPIGGVYSLLQELQTEVLLVLPCDMPRLRSDVYEHLVPHYSGDRPVVATTGFGMEPLVSLWPRACRERLHQNILQGKLSLHKILADLDAILVDMEILFPGETEQLFANINRPSDLERS